MYNFCPLFTLHIFHKTNNINFFLLFFPPSSIAYHRLPFVLISLYTNQIFAKTLFEKLIHRKIVLAATLFERYTSILGIAAPCACSCIPPPLRFVFEFLDPFNPPPLRPRKFPFYTQPAIHIYTHTDSRHLTHTNAHRNRNYYNDENFVGLKMFDFFFFLLFFFFTSSSNPLHCSDFLILNEKRRKKKINK